ncbi:MAG: response regulator [Hyphomicrobiales bacterium]|nr:response regulator [Hyphomicrobiales bacterium]
MATILCIEDEATLRGDIAEELEEAGHEVLQAADGAAGLEMILSRFPDLVISDITMPAMDGFEVLKKVRAASPNFANMPVIFLSALANRDDVLLGLKEGADEYLTKPIDFTLLAVKVEALLRQTERAREKRKEEAVAEVKKYESRTGRKIGDEEVFWG